MAQNKSNDYLTPVEVAEILKLKKNTVYEMIKRGDLRATKLGKQLRINKEDLDTYLNKDKVSASAPAPSFASQNITFTKDSNLDPTTIIICGQDTILDLLCDKINSAGLNTTMMRLRKGSYNALYTVYQHQANIGTCHLWDGETDTYNLTYISKLLPGIQVNVYHILNRVQGFYVAKGNPKKIYGFEDLKRNDIVFANREPGCGTRVLLDEKLQKLRISPRMIEGYEVEKTSHLDCATAVSMGQADVALGNERASWQVPSVDFIPLQTESYDMVIPVKFIDQAPYQMILKILQSEEFRQEVKAMGGYDVTDMGKKLQ